MSPLELSDVTAVDLRLTRPQRQALVDRSCGPTGTQRDAAMVEFLITRADANGLLDER